MMGAAPLGSYAGSNGCSVSRSKYDIFGSLTDTESSGTPEEFSPRNGGKGCEKMLVVPWLRVVGKSDGDKHSTSSGGNTGNKRRYSRRERENEIDDQCVAFPAPVRRKLDDDTEGKKRLPTATTAEFTAGSHTQESSDIHRLIADRYRLGKCIGEGTYSKVYRVYEVDTQLEYAMKVIKKNHRKLQGSLNLCEKEMQILQSLKRHPNIIQIHSVHQNGTHMGMAMDLADGGDIFSRLKRDGHFSEEHCKDVVKMILDGVLHLHNSGVTHRDLKLENILYRTWAHNSEVIISDFGLAHQKEAQSDKCCCDKDGNSGCNTCKNFFSMSGEDGMSTTCGTPEYLSPEMLDGDIYSEKVDLWAVGVVTYALLSGEMPFSNKDGSGRGRARMYRKIKEADYSLEGEIWSKVSDSAKHFISSLLCVDVDKRLDAQSALQHSWLTS